MCRFISLPPCRNSMAARVAERVVAPPLQHSRAPSRQPPLPVCQQPPRLPPRLPKRQRSWWRTRRNSPASEARGGWMPLRARGRAREHVPSGTAQVPLARLAARGGGETRLASLSLGRDFYGGMLSLGLMRSFLAHRRRRSALGERRLPPCIRHPRAAPPLGRPAARAPARDAPLSKSSPSPPPFF